MSKKIRVFQDGLIYVFTKKRFIQDMGIDVYRRNRPWVNRLNGREVRVVSPYFGKAGSSHSLSVSVEWCKCVRRREEK